VGNDFGAEDVDFALKDVGRMTVHGREKVRIEYPGDAQIFCIRNVSNSIPVPRNVLSVRFGQILKVWICLLKENSNIAGVENVLAQNHERAVKVHFGKTNRRLTPRREETCKQEATGDGETTKCTTPVPWHTFHTPQFVAKHAGRHKLHSPGRHNLSERFPGVSSEIKGSCFSYAICEFEPWTHIASVSFLVQYLVFLNIGLYNIEV